MPCYTDPMESVAFQIHELKSKIADLENKSNFHAAIACMLMRTILRDFDSYECLLREMNYTEAGISQQQFTEWWKSHQDKDRARLKTEMISNLKTNIESLSVDQLAKMVAILKND